jgi:hypothetical protein
MDLLSAGAIAAAVTTAANSAGGEVGRAGWESLVALWRRAVRRGTDPDVEPAALLHEDERIRAFAAAVVEECRSNPAFAGEVTNWARRYGFAVQQEGTVTNTVSGTAHVDRLVQARDISGDIIFNG